MTRVARAFAHAPQEVLDWPWHEVLLAAYGLEDVERVDRWHQELDGLRAAFLVNFAVAAPKRLDEERRALMLRLQRGDAPVGDDQDLVAAMLDAATRLKVS